MKPEDKFAELCKQMPVKLLENIYYIAKLECIKRNIKIGR